MSKQKGFSLIELMIAVVIVGVLAAVAFPSYQNYIVKSNRAAAQAFMVDAASREKQYLLDARSYVAVADNSGFSALGMTVPGDVSKHYAVAISAPAGTPPSFIITATPTSSQQTADGALTLDSDGAKSPAGKW